MSAVVMAALRLIRRRSVPGGTVGVRIGSTLSPASSSLREKLTAFSAEPRTSGWMWLGVMVKSGEKRLQTLAQAVAELAQVIALAVHEQYFSSRKRVHSAVMGAGRWRRSGCANG